MSKIIRKIPVSSISRNTMSIRPSGANPVSILNNYNNVQLGGNPLNYPAVELTPDPLDSVGATAYIEFKLNTSVLNDIPANAILISARVKIKFGPCSNLTFSSYLTSPRGTISIVGSSSLMNSSTILEELGGISNSQIIFPTLLDLNGDFTIDLETQGGNSGVLGIDVEGIFVIPEGNICLQIPQGKVNIPLFAENEIYDIPYKPYFGKKLKTMSKNGVKSILIDSGTSMYNPSLKVQKGPSEQSNIIDSRYNFK